MSATTRPRKLQTSLQGEVVWITGASSGLGEYLAYACAEQGASLILSARQEEKLQKVRSRLRYPERAAVLPLDLEDHATLPAIVDAALALHGRVDRLVHNAAIAIRDFALDTTYEVDRKLMDVNYFGPVVLTKALLPHLLERGRGHLVVVSSLSGKYGVPRTAAYAASKHALHGFFETLRSEIAHRGIRITVLVPGIIKTHITAHALTGEGQTFGRMERTFQQAYPVEQAAQQMLKAILKEKEEAFIGGAEGYTLLLQRLSPWLLRRLIRNHPIKRLRRLKQRLALTRKPDELA